MLFYIINKVEWWSMGDMRTQVNAQTPKSETLS